VIRKYGVDVPRDFVLLGRALVVISGLVTQMDPQLQVAEVARPYGRRLLREKASPRNVQRALTSATTLAG
ncbi:MAG: hypothetical protein GTN78_05970, partial [Gemmatimonadales bacterium]|nr:hypothetical protein [Gemmatimonadales bacterium]NIQ99735.1 hypothetical protein [Gemmatimonadales bacterium]